MNDNKEINLEFKQINTNPATTRQLSAAISKVINGGDMTPAVNTAFKLTDGRCLYCGNKLYIYRNNKYKLIAPVSFDHIIPSSVCGLFAPGNIALTCESCNHERGNATAEAYFDLRYKKNLPSLFDTKEEFVKKLNEFFDIYREYNEPLFEIGYQALYSDTANIEFSIDVTSKDGLLSSSVKVPIISRDTTSQDLSNLQEIADLKNHLRSLITIENAEKRKHFEHAMDVVFNEFKNKDVYSIGDFRVASVSTYNAVLSAVNKHNVSHKRAVQVIKLLKVSFDKQLTSKESMILNEIPEGKGQFIEHE